MGDKAAPQNLAHNGQGWRYDDAGEAKEIELGHEFVVQWASSRYMCLTRRMVERFPCQRTDLAVIVPIQTENDAFALDLLFDLPDFLSVILEARHS